MYTIWKYEVEPDFVNQVYEMPTGAVILSFGFDANSSMCFWALVDDQAPKENHTVACVGTGWPIDNAMGNDARYSCFIGTAVCGSYVWHLFDLGGAGACSIKNETAPKDAQE